MTNALLVTAVVSFFCAGLWGQAANSPDGMNAAANHAKDPVGFELLDKLEPDDSVYPEDVVSTIQARWYLLVSQLRRESYDQQGVAVIEFRI